ncbi:PAS domain-containing protein [Sphingomonas sp. PP-CC-3A-396]|uniref:PAS domain-containing protein n=1 Tax=Sphingomonas sp. PP-CC-3A-396 TaxID=2135655 RepID=UPI0010EF5274|nr:PAS domain-containing protein [Sphingomonas sp. PP-CC-3A-396]TCQ03925.1 PAS domain S-box-containing protein [Sphingomonas sp. PP-CC-3A-396]
MTDTTDSAVQGVPKMTADAERIAAEVLGQDVGTDPFVAAVRATRMPMIITNPRLPDNPVVFANNAFCRLSGYTREEILGRNCRFLQGPATDPATVAKIRDAVRRVESIEIDIRNQRKDGELFWNRLLMAPVYDTEGVLAYFFASQVDVTIERERLHGLEVSNASLMAELTDRLRLQKEQERELAFTLKAARFGTWTLDIVSRQLIASETCKEIFGRPVDQPFTYDERLQAIHPDDREKSAAEVRRCIAEGNDYDVIYRIYRQDGEVRWIASRGQPFYDAKGEALRIAGVSTDITEHKRNEIMRAGLVELGDVFRDTDQPEDIAFAAARIIGKTLEASRAGFGEIDLAAETVTIVRDWSAPTVAPLTGTFALRAYGSYIDDLKRGEEVCVADARTDPRTGTTTTALEALDARAIINMPVMENGRLVAMLYIASAGARRWRPDEVEFIREVAERTRIATQRRLSEHALSTLAASLEQQVAARTSELQTAEDALRQSQKMEAVGQLTGGVAHDFNNLLTVIRSATDLLKRPDLSAERRERYIDAISDTADRAAKLTGQLLAFARRQALQPEVIDVGQSLRVISDMLGTLIGSRIVIAIDLPDTACFTNVDPSQLDTALVNMAVNARDAMEGAGRIDITVRSAGLIPAVRSHPAVEGRFIAIAMADSGSGIEPDKLERIFEPFFTTKGVGQGTGLGLSQVFGFAKQSGGDITVESEVGRGTVFTLYLPQVDQGAPAEVDDVGEGLADGHGTCVLVVEDNSEVGTFTTQSLAELGYVTVWAADAQEALAELAVDATRFDIVFSDVVMPGMNGIELGKVIRDRYPTLPVVLTSGYSNVLAQDGTHGFELLHKPYSVEQLSRILSKVVG